MSMRQRLDLKQGQSLVMTPQLQQAIKLLELSNIELAEFVAAEIERNPLLQRGENEGDDADERGGDVEPQRREELTLDAGTGLGAAKDQLDAPQADVFEPGTGSDAAMPASEASGPSATTDWSRAGNGAAMGDSIDFEAALTRELTLREHLLKQVQMSGFDPVDSLIASQLVEDTDDVGYCRANTDELANSLGTDEAHVLAVLKRCQTFEPTGVMARSVNECLALQLAEQNRLDPAMERLVENLDLVAKHDIARLANICGVDKSDIKDMIIELRALTPRPGGGFAGDTAVAVAPDVYVRELPNGMFAVELNSGTLPRVLMDNAYYAEVSALPMRENDKQFITECAADASWLIKSLDQRARTILKVASEIVRQQDGFFAKGVAHLRPLNLKQVADAIEMHESTVSRVTSNKFMATPRGLFNLKYFFSAAIPSTGGGEAHSAEAVRYRIKQLIDEETIENVLSDDQIVEILTEFGIEIARRTVAKYRESLGIPSSVQRRRMLRASA